MWCIGSSGGFEAGSGRVGARGSGDGPESCLEVDLDEETSAAMRAGSLRGIMVE